MSLPRRSTSSLHTYDLLLCNYIRDVIRGYLPQNLTLEKLRDLKTKQAPPETERPPRVATTSAVTSRPIKPRSGLPYQPPWFAKLSAKEAFAHLVARAVRNERLQAYLVNAQEHDPRLLNEAELGDLVIAFGYGDPQMDRFWNPSIYVHRHYIDCIGEINKFAAPEGREFSELSAKCIGLLNRPRVRLHDGIAIVARWVAPLRRILHAMGRDDQIPRPEGKFPTPTTEHPGLDDQPESVQVAIQCILVEFAKRPSLAKLSCNSIQEVLGGKRETILAALKFLIGSGQYTGRGHRPSKAKAKPPAA